MEGFKDIVDAFGGETFQNKLDSPKMQPTFQKEISDLMEIKP